MKHLRNHIRFESIDSTNRFLKSNYMKYNCGTVVTSNHQTHGCGRSGNIWADEAGKDILMSILWKREAYQKLLTNLSLKFSMIIHKFCNKYKNDFEIKYPNDLLYMGNKVGGILVESLYSTKHEYVIVGIGLNINSQKTENKTSLKEITKREFNIDVLIIELMEFIDKEISNLIYFKDNEDYINYINKFNYFKNKQINYQNNILCNIVIDNNGFLQGENGKQKKVLIRKLSYSEYYLLS